MFTEYGGEYGEDGLANQAFIVDNSTAFIHGLVIKSSSRLAHIRATTYILDSFVPVRLYINGINTSANITDSTLAHISFSLFNISSNKGATIVSPAIIMRLLTRDGNADLNTTILDDSSSINNDGAIFGMPTWIVGPHG